MMTTKTNKPGKPAEKPLTIIVTVLPPKRGLRTMIVSAAREGEMPLVLGGPFADRHHLLDQAYAAVLKRDPQVVTVKEEKSANKANRAPKTDAQISDEAEEAADQMVEAESVPVSTIIGTDELPAIEGDTDGVETLHATSPQDGAEASDGEQN